MPSRTLPGRDAFDSLYSVDLRTIHGSLGLTKSIFQLLRITGGIIRPVATARVQYMKVGVVPGMRLTQAIARNYGRYLEIDDIDGQARTIVSAVPYFEGGLLPGLRIIEVSAIIFTVDDMRMATYCHIIISVERN